MNVVFGRSVAVAGSVVLAVGALSAPGQAAVAPAEVNNSVVQVASEAQYEVFHHQGLVYGTGATARGPMQLKMDLFTPRGPAPEGGWPAIVMAHGGSFVKGSRTEVPLAQIGQFLAERGFVVALPDYRLLGDGPAELSPELVSYFSTMPGYQTDRGKLLAPAVIAAMEDFSKAVQWVLCDSRVNVNPEKVSVGGESAGAITALHAAYVRDDAGLEPLPVRSVVSLWGGFVATPGAAPALEAGEAPVMAVHGTDDDELPYLLSGVIAQRATEVGVPVRFHTKPGSGHGFSRNQPLDVGPDGARIVDQMYSFLTEVPGE